MMRDEVSAFRRFHAFPIRKREEASRYCEEVCSCGKAKMRFARTTEMHLALYSFRLFLGTGDEPF